MEDVGPHPSKVLGACRLSVDRLQQVQRCTDKQIRERKVDRGVSKFPVDVSELRKILTSTTGLIHTHASSRKDHTTGKRPGLKYTAVKRLNGLMADGKKRSEAKAQARLRGESLFAFSDGGIHAYESRNNYQKIIMRFINWVGEEHNVRDQVRLDERADELASLYLSERIAQGYSAWTLQTERSALRMFFQNRILAASVELPKRQRENIVRSRRPAVRDRHFQAANWQPFINFCLACGLRREELRDLYVHDVFRNTDGELLVHVVKGKGGKDRKVPVFPGREQSVLGVTEGRSGDEKAFARLPSAMDIHAYRRRFAQELYEYHAQRPLPPREGRLQSADFDRVAAEKVTKALGHGRLDIVFGHYIR